MKHVMTAVTVASGCGRYKCSCGWQSQVSCDGDQDPNRAYDQQLRHLAQAGLVVDSARSGKPQNAFMIPIMPADRCPVTGREFFMILEHPQQGQVATYGGPFDSYTVPVWDPANQEFRSERYDHDAGTWVDGGEPYPFILVDESGLEREGVQTQLLRDVLDVLWDEKYLDLYDQLVLQTGITRRGLKGGEPPSGHGPCGCPSRG